MTSIKLPVTLQLYKAHTISELKIFTEFINHNSVHITSLQEIFERRYNEGAPPSGYGEDEPTDNYWQFEHYKFHEAFPTFYLQTIFYGLYSFLETRLLSLCENIHRLKGYKIKPSDLNSDNYLDLSRKYLSLVANIDTNDLNDKWSKIRDYQKIRNCLIHNNGVVKKERLKEWQRLVENIQNVSLNSNRIAIDNDKFLLDFIELVNQYILEVLEKIKSTLNFE
jgi:hypothetical protein